MSAKQGPRGTSVSCRPSDSGFAANLCNEISIDQDSIFDCFHLTQSDAVKIDITSDEHPSSLDVSRVLYNETFHIVIDRSGVAEEKGTFPLTNMTSIAMTRKRFVDHIQTLCQ
jgi:hypothetical protein